jgi:hypothetical protein
VYQIPDGGATGVVAQPRPDCATAGTLSRPAKILNPPRCRPPGVREEMRDDPPELPLEGQHLLGLGRDEHLEVGWEVHQPTRSRARRETPPWPLTVERLTESTSGLPLYHFRRPWRDGSTALLLDPLELLERLAALVPTTPSHYPW